jgi:hypothetical protein
MNLREAYANTHHASLEWSEERERAIDRVAAAGRCSRIGMDLWKARYMLESQSYQDCAGSLLLQFQARYKAESQTIARKCVDEALHEFLGPECAMCSGAGEIMAGELKVTCHVCEGSKLRLYTDIDRARHMELSLGMVRKLAGKLAWLMRQMHDMDRAVSAVMAWELER